MDQDLSDKDRFTFYHPATKKAVVSFRGTNVTNIGDLAADVAIAKGQQNHAIRFKNSKKLTEKAIQKYGKENVSLTGHSLGGSQAIMVAQQLGLTAHAYNPGVGPKTALTQAISKLFSKNTKGSVNIYHTGMKDPISALSPALRGNVRRIAPRFSKNPHSVDNFIF